MDRIKHFLHRKLTGYTIDQYIIMVVCSSIFLPYYITIATVFICILYLCFTKKIKGVLTSVPKSKYLFIFWGLIFLLALISENWLGALCSIAILIILIFLLYYRLHINKRLFEFIMDASCLVSWLCVFLAVVEFYMISHSMDVRFLAFNILDDPQYRINSTFFNANYYAMMIEFLILICVYKMMKVRSFRRFLYYVVTIISNLFALYLTGCRTAWAPFLITIPIMFFLNKKTFYFRSTMGIYAVGAMVLLINPDLFPRIDTLAEYFMARVDIWEAASRGIMAHPLFGKGPLTYGLDFWYLGGPATHHSHSVYLDPLLSFGIVPLFFFAKYLWAQGKEVWHLYSRKGNIRLFSLIIGFIVTVLLHGIFDYTIFWIQTAMLFFVVLGAASMYENKNYKA